MSAVAPMTATLTAVEFASINETWVVCMMKKKRLMVQEGFSLAIWYSLLLVQEGFSLVICYSLLLVQGGFLLGIWYSLRPPGPDLPRD